MSDKRKQKFVPLDQIVPEKWNEEYFEDMKEELKNNGCIACVVIGSSPPKSGKKEFFVGTPPGFNGRMALIALRVAIKQIEEVVALENAPKSKDVN